MDKAAFGGFRARKMKIISPSVASKEPDWSSVLSNYYLKVIII